MPMEQSHEEGNEEIEQGIRGWLFLRCMHSCCERRGEGDENNCKKKQLQIYEKFTKKGLYFCINDATIKA